jgi:hypothetical protein
VAGGMMNLKLREEIAQLQDRQRSSIHPFPLRLKFIIMMASASG